MCVNKICTYNIAIISSDFFALLIFDLIRQASSISVEKETVDYLYRLLYIYSFFLISL